MKSLGHTGGPPPQVVFLSPCQVFGPGSRPLEVVVSWIGRDRMETYPRWVLASIVVGMALLAVPPTTAVDIVCAGLVIVAAATWAARPEAR